MIYNIAKNLLGKHLTLDASVPAELGCAEAVSYVLRKVGVRNFPTNGFAGTHDLFDWLNTSPEFVEIFEYEPGAIVISPSGLSTKGAVHGHVGICALHGILSNDSQSGLFLELWDLESWQTYYGKTLGFPVHYFRMIIN